MKTKKLQEIVLKVENRKLKEKSLFWHSKRGAHELNYSDFNDLATIIETHKTKFDQYFDSKFKKSYWICLLISELNPSRNVTAHNNPLSKQDIIRLETNYKDWEKQIENINSNFTF